MKLLYINFEQYRGPSVHIRGFITGFESLGNTVITNNSGILSGDDGRQKEETVNRPKPKTLVGRIRRSLGFGKYIIQMIFAELRTVKPYVEVIRKEKPDALLVRHRLNTFGGYWLSRKTGIPLFLEVNAPSILEGDRAGILYHKWISLLLNRLNFNHAKAIICVSQAVKDLLVRECAPAEKISVAPNGADITRFDPSARDESWIQEPHGPVVGFVGAMHLWHGREVLTAMIPLVVKEVPDIRFLIVGGGEGVEKLKAQMEALGLGVNMVYTGLVPHDRVPAAIGLMDITLAPYPKIDGFYYSPLKIFEYMAMGKPTVASAEGQICELLEHRRTGMLVEPGDPQAFADAVVELCRDKSLREQMGKAARAEVETNYTWQMTAKKIQTIIETYLLSKDQKGTVG